jgi:hypothetical protein
MPASAQTGFDTYYGDTPTAVLDQNQRDWFHPVVDKVFREKSVFTGLVPFARNLGSVNAKNMTITQLLGLHPDFDSIGLRDIWLSAGHIDSRNVTVTFNRYAGKVAYMDYDDIITYWKTQDSAGQKAVMAGILRAELGDQMIDVNDLLIRNAFLSGEYQLYAGDATGFSGLGASDTFDIDVVKDMWLGHANRGLPMAIDPSLPGGNNGSILCITSPGAIHAIMGVEDWVSRHQYTDQTKLLRYEVGSLWNTRFMQTNRMILFNCGELIFRATLDGAHAAGDGSPDPESETVDGVYKTGQKAAQHYLQLDDPDTGSWSDLAVNDIVSIHTDVTSAFGVTGGADYRDGTKQERRVIAIDEGNKRIKLDKPIMTNFASGTYVTLATHVHAALFIGGPNGVVAGVGRPVRFNAPDPTDDLQAIFRFAWDMYIGYNVFAPEVFDVYYFVAPIRYKGAKKTQTASA